jgi:hypothetical protein
VICGTQSTATARLQPSSIQLSIYSLVLTRLSQTLTKMTVTPLQIGRLWGKRLRAQKVLVLIPLLLDVFSKRVCGTSHSSIIW